MNIKRGDIFWIDLSGNEGSEMGNSPKGNPHPGIIIQNDIGNRNSPLTIVAPMTSYDPGDEKYPQNVVLESEDTGLNGKSTALLNQIRTLDKEERLVDKAGSISNEKMSDIDKAIEISLGLRAPGN